MTNYTYLLLCLFLFYSQTFFGQSSLCDGLMVAGFVKSGNLANDKNQDIDNIILDLTEKLRMELKKGGCSLIDLSNKADLIGTVPELKKKIDDKADLILAKLRGKDVKKVMIGEVVGLPDVYVIKVKIIDITKENLGEVLAIEDEDIKYRLELLNNDIRKKATKQLVKDLLNLEQFKKVNYTIKLKMQQCQTTKPITIFVNGENNGKLTVNSFSRNIQVPKGKIKIQFRKSSDECFSDIRDIQEENQSYTLSCDDFEECDSKSIVIDPIDSPLTPSKKVYEVRQNDIKTINEPLLEVDEFILQNNSILRIENIAEFKLRANTIKIGRNCTIIAQGKEGQDGRTGTKGKRGKNGIYIDIEVVNLSIAGQLEIDISGGDGGSGNPGAEGGYQGNLKYKFQTEDAQQTFINQITVIKNKGRKGNNSFNFPNETARNQYLRQQVSNQISLLQNYLSTIGDKSKPVDVRRDAIKSAKKLFLAGAKMEVSNVNRKTVNAYPIGTYMVNLMNLPYDQVKITYKPHSVSDITPLNPDNTSFDLEGTFYQKFEGSNNGETVYSDLTIKKIDVSINEIVNDFTGKIYYDVKFKYISVEKTLTN